MTVHLPLERGGRVGRSDLLLTVDAFNLLGASAVTEVQTSSNGKTDPFASGRLGAVRNRLTPRPMTPPTFVACGETRRTRSVSTTASGPSKTSKGAAPSLGSGSYRCPSPSLR